MAHMKATIDKSDIYELEDELEDEVYELEDEVWQNKVLQIDTANLFKT